MTTKDKTGDRLVASIRRTRAGNTKPDDAAAPAEKAPARAATSRKTRAPAQKKRTTGAVKSRAAKQPEAAKDGYRSSGRVWPD